MDRYVGRRCTHVQPRNRDAPVRKSGSEAKRFVLVIYDNTIDLHTVTEGGDHGGEHGGGGGRVSMRSMVVVVERKL